jgi:putative tricarboxylic transport membrane protein
VKVSDAIAGALFLAFGVAVMAATLRFPDMPGQPYGAATFPLLIGGGFVLVAVALIVRGIADWHSLPGILLSDWGRSPRAWLRIALTVLLVTLYIAFSDLLGFTLSSFLVLMTLFLVMQVRPVTAVVVAVAATIVTQQAFGVLLRVPLPRSDYFGFLW